MNGSETAAQASFARLRSGEEVDRLAALLRASDLPAEDLGDPRQRFFRRHDPDRRVVGYIGLELHGREALLRSLLVVEGARGHGHGSALVDYAARQAAAMGIEELYLLTTTAAGFFAARGFEPVERSAVPPAIAASREFASLCPASAVVMRRRLTEAS